MVGLDIRNAPFFGALAPSMFCSSEPYLVLLPFCTDCRWAAGCLGFWPNARGTGPLLALDTCYSVVVFILDVVADILLIHLLFEHGFAHVVHV